MGIPGLTAKVQKHMKRVSPELFHNCTFLVDGPSLAYHICNTTQFTYPDYGSYGLYATAAKQIISRLQSMCQKCVVYFDGDLPQWKREVRLARSAKFIASDVLIPVMAPQMLYEALQDFSIETRVVPGEADMAIAAVAQQFDKPVVLSNDSDFYTFRFEQASVGMLALSSCDFTQPEAICTFVHIESTRPTVDTALMQPVPKELPDSRHRYTLLKMHELANTKDAEEDLEAYLPVMFELANTAPAWQHGKVYRSYAYSRVWPATQDYQVDEYMRVGMKYRCEPLQVFNASTYDYAAEIDPCVGKREDLIHLMIDEVCSGSNTPRKLRTAVLRYFEQMHKPHDDMPPVRVRTGHQAIQVFARIQTVFYSLYMLQDTGVKLGITLRLDMVQWNLFARLVGDMGLI